VEWGGLQLVLLLMQAAQMGSILHKASKIFKGSTIKT
jgi:hypothetical protein